MIVIKNKKKILKKQKIKFYKIKIKKNKMKIHILIIQLMKNFQNMKDHNKNKYCNK